MANIGIEALLSCSFEAFQNLSAFILSGCVRATARTQPSLHSPPSLGKGAGGWGCRAGTVTIAGIVLTMHDLLTRGCRAGTVIIAGIVLTMHYFLLAVVR